MTYEERLHLFKSRVSTKPCTFGDENDREGITHEIRDTDFEWLMSVLKGKDTAIESFSRIVDGMIADYEKAKTEIEILKKQALEPDKRGQQ